MYFPGECAERLWSSLIIGKNDWHGVWRKGGGQLSTIGIKLHSVTSHKFVLDGTIVYVYGGNVQNGGDRTWRRGEWTANSVAWLMVWDASATTA
jgi:hypothetical protein